MSVVDVDYDLATRQIMTNAMKLFYLECKQQLQLLIDNIEDEERGLSLVELSFVLCQERILMAFDDSFCR